MQTLFTRKPDEQTLLEERPQYDRSQMILARKAVLMAPRIQNEFARAVFRPEVYEEVVVRYQRDAISPRPKWKSWLPSTAKR